MKTALAIIAAVLASGCASKPAYIEFYPPETDAERASAHGAVKVIDYRKPQGAVTVFGFSLY